MPTSTRQFNIELYREHLDEASFLYQQRLAYLHDPEVNWPDLVNWEARFETHIDALVVGDDLALDVCRRGVAEGDAGEKHAALLVFCRQRSKDEAFAMLEALDPGDEAIVHAVSHALRSEGPAGWRDDLVKMFESDRAHLTHVLAHVIGYRRLSCEEQLLHKLAAKPQFGTAEIAWALGRVGTRKSIPALWMLLDSDHEPTIDAAAIALLRLGDERVVERAMQEAPDRAWARRALGVGGGPKAVRLLLDILKTDALDANGVLALGMLGDLAAVIPLVDLLEDDTVGASAAVALNTITGAGRYGRTFVPDTFDADELSDEEREAYERDGTVPTRQGEPYGNWERGPARDQAGWRKWLDENKQNFRRGYRWRMGRLYGPSALYECLCCSTSPYAIRAASYEELVVRYAMDVPFEVELPVKHQSRFLQQIAQWGAAKDAQSTPGHWYFATQRRS